MTAKWLARVTYVKHLGRVLPASLSIDHGSPGRRAVSRCFHADVTIKRTLSNGRATERRASEPRHSLSDPGCVLAIRAIAGVNFLRWMPLFALSSGSRLRIDRVDRQRRSAYARTSIGNGSDLLFATFYALGVATQADQLLDRSTPQVFRVVLSKRVARSSKSTTYYLRVEPWGPKRDANDVSVPGRLLRCGSAQTNRLHQSVRRCAENSLVLRDGMPLKPLYI